MISSPRTPAQPESPETPDEPGLTDRARQEIEGYQKQWEFALRFAKANRNRGQVATGSLLALVIGISVALLVGDAILADAVNDFAGANTSNLSGNQQTMYNLIPTFALLALALVFVGGAIDAI